MEIQLNIDPSDLAKKITEAMTSQAFSEMFKKAVEEELTNLTKSTYSHDSVLKTIVKSFFAKKMEEILDTEFNEKAKDACRKVITDTKIEELAMLFVKKIRLSDY